MEYPSICICASSFQKTRWVKGVENCYMWSRRLFNYWKKKRQMFEKIIYHHTVNILGTNKQTGQWKSNVNTNHAEQNGNEGKGCARKFLAIVWVLAQIVSLYISNLKRD